MKGREEGCCDWESKSGMLRKEQKERQEVMGRMLRPGDDKGKDRKDAETGRARDGC